MADASYAVGNFTGGELSAFAQGRFDKPDYRNSLKICLNGFPGEIGPWSRRPGTKHAGLTRGGAPGRNVKFDFQQSSPITAEFTDGFVRFRNGTSLIMGNDTQVVVGVSAANPAVVQTTSAVTWASGDTLVFPGASAPLLENRQFTATKVDTTHFSLADAITGVAIDGSTLGALVAGATVARVHELATSYTGQAWSGIRAVQAETTDILLTSTVAPQALTVTTLPSTGVNPVLAIAAATFNDGPYLDPFINGVQATPSAKSGIISLTLAFPTYDSTKAYGVGAFVTSAAINYISLQDQNVNNTPAGSPLFWATTAATAAINNGRGFLGTDIGRLVRLLSEPALWAVGTAYAVGNTVAYNPSGVPGAATYWQALTVNTGKLPGSDLTNWQIIPQGGAIWSWGKITSLSNIIDRALAGSTSIGNMASGGGLNSVFDGTFVKTQAASAFNLVSGGGVAGGTTFTHKTYVGKNYSGASAQKIQQVTIYPTSDKGFANGIWNASDGNAYFMTASITLNLRGKATAPASSSDGTVIGALSPLPNTLSPYTVVSLDTATAWNYVWVEMVTTFFTFGTASILTYEYINQIAQVSFFNPPGSGTAAGVNVEILGPALPYTNPIITWRLGLYSNTTGWPTCGVYNDGRLYLGGAVGNRFDTCVSNGISGSTVNFAPTDQFGVVSAASAISYTFNANGVNQILWMDPDLQGVKMGTQAGEWLVQAPTAGSISPTNITARNVTNHGSANIQPCRTEHTTVFVQRFAQKLLEYFPDVFSGKFSAPNLADKAQHITHPGVAELAYTSAVTPILWGRDALGALFGITYKRDSLASAQPPTFYGWHRHTLGSGRTVESICSGPSAGGSGGAAAGSLDALTLVTRDATSPVRHVEILTDASDELSTLASSWFLDNAVNPTSVSSTATTFTINGLWHLNGKTVQVFAGGLDLGDPGEGKAFSDFVVSNGSVTVTFGDGITAGAGRGLFTSAFANPLSLSQIVVGFTYNSDGQLVRPILQADTGARNGPAFAKLSRAHRFGMKLVNTLGLFVGGSFSNLKAASFKKSDGVTNIDAGTTFSGILQDSLNDDYQYDGGLCWRISRPFPANIVVIGVNQATQDQ